jgi:hypothetical protein
MMNPTPGQLHQISAEIGGLKKAVEMMTDMWTRQEETASAGRKALHDKFEMFRWEITNQVASLGLRVDRMSDQINIVEPSVKNFNDERLRAEGAKRLGKMLIAALTAVAGVLGWGAHELIARLFPPH